MGNGMPWWVLPIVTALLCCAAICVAVFWERAGASSPLWKRVRALETQITDLSSNFDSLMDSHKRLSARVGMRNLRERRKGEGEDHEPIPPGDKAALRRRYLNGKSHIEIARQVAGLQQESSE
jgi:hypothetical protein